MGWWQTKKARKNLEKLGFSKQYLNDMQNELREGYQNAKKVRNELRKLESPTYNKLLAKINQIIGANGTKEQKKQFSIKLVNNALLSDFERNDLLEQVEIIYGKSSKQDDQETEITLIPTYKPPKARQGSP